MSRSYITENELDHWVRGHAHEARGVIVDLVWRLVAASSPGPKQRRFPLGDSQGQPGPDGDLEVDFPFEPFVPLGRSFWEIGVGSHPGHKATSDYTHRVRATPESIRRETTFIFVTPLSGQTAWPHTWKEDAQALWLEKRCKRNDWRDVRVIDGTKLVDWLHQFPAVEAWLACRMDIPVEQIETPEQHWDILRTIGSPPPLIPELFLANRDAACAKLKEVFAGTITQLRLDTHFPEQLADYVSAYVAAMDEASRADAMGRCLIVSGEEAWNYMVTQPVRHILTATLNLDQPGSSGAILLERARRAGHVVIYSGMPGGIPHPYRESLPNPRSHHVEEMLTKAGYGDERARVFANRSGGNLTFLIRCLHNLSLSPAWAETTPAAELAVAQLLGGWDERAEADHAAVEDLSGNSFGEWLGKMRDVALRPNTPISCSGGVWTFTARYEGWYALGPRVFDEHLDRLRQVAIRVLREQDPRFEMAPDDRFTAPLYGKVLLHSTTLRHGLADTLALLGTHSRALTSCSPGHAERTAALTVRSLLFDVDWVRWASLNDVLPLLAEATPEQFLDAIETALASDPCPIDMLFAQEGPAITGSNYMTGLLWALETLAWDPQYLVRVVAILGELAERDPGGQWGNRPGNSLRTILLPWFPQTCAPPEKRRVAVTTLLQALPDVGWRTLLSLLPETHSGSAKTRRPAWRQTIPEDWIEGSTATEYRKQIGTYADLALNVAQNDLAKLVELCRHLDRLPPPALEKVLAHLSADAVISLPETDRLSLWTELTDLATKHRRFASADWAMSSEWVDRIIAVVEQLAPETPALRHQRLFRERDHDLYEVIGNYADQQQDLDQRRQRAVEEIVKTGGVQAVVTFAASVEAPWRVGLAFGFLAAIEADCAILPSLLQHEEKALIQFAGGFVWGRHRSRGWQWVDGLDTSEWDPAQIGRFLSHLPFTSGTWARSARLLGEDEAPYWREANVNPYQTDAGLGHAVDKLNQHGRPRAALGCLYAMLHAKQEIDSAQAIHTLLLAVDSSEPAHAMITHEAAEIIGTLQDDPGANLDDVLKVEWSYLPLLQAYHNAFPRALERRLADESGFFCQMIRLVFWSRKNEHKRKILPEDKSSIIGNGYRLLHKWRTPPGLQRDDSFDGDALHEWLAEVRAECARSGHLEVAMTMVGRAFIHAPADPDGLWIHRSVAMALNERDADDMRNGFYAGIRSSRGVYWVDPTGRPEMELAAKYERQAEEAENAGYHRLASTMRGVASSYRYQAEETVREHLNDVD